RRVSFDFLPGLKRFKSARSGVNPTGHADTTPVRPGRSAPGISPQIHRVGKIVWTVDHLQHACWIRLGQSGRVKVRDDGPGPVPLFKQNPGHDQNHADDDPETLHEPPSATVTLE